MPAGYPIANDLDTNDAQQALSAAMGYKLARTHWNGKKWYGFGTSITNTSSEGKYATYLAALSGMTFVNCGHSGGGITTGSNQSIYTDVMTRSLSDADLITLEVGANEGNAVLGSVYDGLAGETVTDNSTFCGALNLCIRHLLATTSAQIAVFQSAAQRYWGQKQYQGNEKYANGNRTILDMTNAIEQVCRLNSVYFIDTANGLGLARLNSNNNYNVDNIHHTALGGYNFAQAIWSQLKNIPLFYTAVPT